MKHPGRWLLALVIVFAAIGPAVWADDKPTDPPKRDEDAKEKAAKQRQKIEQRDSAVFGSLAKHAVVIRLRFQKDLEAEATGVEPPDRNSLSERYRTYRMSDVKPGFQVDEAMLGEFRAFLADVDYKISDEEFEESAESIGLRLRAQIARIEWDQVEEARILAEQDPQIQRAMELFDEAASLDRSARAPSADNTLRSSL